MAGLLLATNALLAAPTECSQQTIVFFSFLTKHRLEEKCSNRNEPEDLFLSNRVLGAKNSKCALAGRFGVRLNHSCSRCLAYHNCSCCLACHSSCRCVARRTLQTGNQCRREANKSLPAFEYFTVGCATRFQLGRCKARQVGIASSRKGFLKGELRTRFAKYLEGLILSPVPSRD